MQVVRRDWFGSWGLGCTVWHCEFWGLVAKGSGFRVQGLGVKRGLGKSLGFRELRHCVVKELGGA